MSFKIKRMAILARRDGDDRAFFSRHWHDVHGPLVAGLPNLRRYLQNHVLEDFPVGGAIAFPVDGFVEQFWDSAADMQQGYGAPQVQKLLADEPNYIGAGSNYAMLASAPPRPAPDGAKVIAVIRHRGDIAIAEALAALAITGCGEVVRDDVIAVIPKIALPPPLPADAFLHFYFDDAASARAGGQQIAARSEAYLGHPHVAIGVVQVRTATII